MWLLPPLTSIGLIVLLVAAHRTVLPSARWLSPPQLLSRLEMPLSAKGARAAKWPRRGEAAAYAAEHAILVGAMGLAIALFAIWQLHLWRDVLWPGLVRHFAKSAGSSRREGSFKHLPLSELQVRLQGRQAFDLLARYLVRSGDRSFTGGFALGLLPPPTVTWDGEVGQVGSTNNPGFTA